jgi:pyruvate,orthophosphate dikinase
LYVYSFEEGNTKLRNLLGGKGADLAEMVGLGLPVPPGITITTEACNYFSTHGKFPNGLEGEILSKVKLLEAKTMKGFGSDENPLLVSVRSGAPISMPGMMDTVLNLGLNDKTVQGLIKQTQDDRFAYDAYRRFIQMFGKVVLGVEGNSFEEILTKYKASLNVKSDAELDPRSLLAIVRDFKELVKQNTGRTFPEAPIEQLMMAVVAVFQSWNGRRAIDRPTTSLIVWEPP